jgi:hypothetical protein
MRIGSRLIGSSQEGDCNVSHLEARGLRTPTASLLALRGLGMGPSPLCSSLFQSTAVDDGEVVASATIVANHVVISRDREVALRASQA